MAREDDLSVPETTKGDIAHSVARATVASVPIVGGALTELFDWVVIAPLEKRRNAWKEGVAERLQRLEIERGVDLGSLRNDEEFITVLTHASQAAMRNHQKEKLAALGAAVTNAAMKVAPEIDLQLMFVRWVDELTVSHLRLLTFLDDPPQAVAEQGKRYSPGMSSNLVTPLELAIPELEGKREVYDQLGADLSRRGLINSGGFHVIMSARGWASGQTTSLGGRFLRYITNPIESWE